MSPAHSRKMLGANAAALPAPVSGVALIDTGATATCVHEPVLQQLGLNPIGTIDSGTAAGLTQHKLYPARLEFPADGIDREFNSVAGVNLAGQAVILGGATHPIIALIGRDVLSDWILIYNGVGGVVTISF